MIELALTNVLGDDVAEEFVEGGVQANGGDEGEAFAEVFCDFDPGVGIAGCERAEGFAEGEVGGDVEHEVDEPLGELYGASFELLA